MTFRRLISTVFPSMLAGGLLFGSAFGHADDGRTLVGFWPAASDSGATIGATGAAGPANTPPAPPRAPTPTPPSPHSVLTPPVPPVPPSSHNPPMPPIPPMPPHHAGSGITVQIHDGKVEIDGVKQLVDSQLDTAMESLKSAKGLPPDVRAKLEKRVQKLRDKLGKRLNHLDVSDMDELGEELGKMGEDIGQEMEQFGQDMDKWGKDWNKQLGKDFAKKWTKGFKGNWNVHVDNSSDDDADLPSAPDPDDADDVDDALSNIGDLSLKPAQRDAIQKIRSDSDRQVNVAKKQLENASAHLKQLLDNPSASDADVTQSIEAVSQLEGQIRKARILAWVSARRVLEEAQRKKIEAATKGKTK